MAAQPRYRRTFEAQRFLDFLPGTVGHRLVAGVPVDPLAAQTVGSDMDGVSTGVPFPDRSDLQTQDNWFFRQI